MPVGAFPSTRHSRRRKLLLNRKISAPPLELVTTNGFLHFLGPGFLITSILFVKIPENPLNSKISKFDDIFVIFQQTSQRLGLRVMGQGDKALVEDSAMARNPFSQKVEKTCFLAHFEISPKN